MTDAQQWGGMNYSLPDPVFGAWNNTGSPQSWGSTGGGAFNGTGGQFLEMGRYQNGNHSTTPWGDMGIAGKLGVVGQGIGAFTSLANLYGMFKNLGFQKKAFKFAQEGTKRNFNANATGFNNSVIQRENANAAYAAANPGRDYSGMQSYGKVDNWT